jgi:15-cis-phytoene synthase
MTGRPTRPTAQQTHTTALAEAYARSRDINRTHGRSYFLATRLLPPAKRPHVHALYGFARWADDIVDDGPGGRSVEERQRRLDEWGSAFLAGLAGAPVEDPLLPAVLHTVRTFDLDLDDFDKFLRSMAMDLKVTGYRTYEDLLGYMEGSAAVIGTMMLPILGLAPGADPAVARESARQLGFAFQLTNFIRDVGEDLDRGRVYLPEEDLARFGLTREALARDARAGTSTEPVRELIRHECFRALTHYRAALPGLAELAPRSQVCIRAAYLLYGGILDEVGRRGYEVLAGRARVPRRRRAAIVLGAVSPRRFADRIHRWHVR